MFDLDDPTIPKERFGGVNIPLHPFKTEIVSDWDEDSVIWAGDVAQKICKKASIHGEAVETIKRFALSAQETIYYYRDPIECAKTLAGVYWSVRRDHQTPVKERQTALTCLSEITNRSGYADLIHEFVAMIGARAALEEAKNPKKKALLVAAARGDEEASKRLKEPTDPLGRNEYFDKIMKGALAEGWNDAFFSGLKARAETQLREVEKTVAKAIAFRVLNAKDNPSLRQECKNIENSMSVISMSLERLDKGHPGNKAFISDVIGNILKDNYKELVSEEDILSEVGQLIDSSHVSSNTKRMAHSFLEAYKDCNAVVLNELYHITIHMTFINVHLIELDKTNPDASRLARSIITREFKNNTLKSDFVTGRLLTEIEKTAKVLGAFDAEILKFLRPLDDQNVQDERIRRASGSQSRRDRAEAERD